MGDSCCLLGYLRVRFWGCDKLRQNESNDFTAGLLFGHFEDARADGFKACLSAYPTDLRGAPERGNLPSAVGRVALISGSPIFFSDVFEEAFDGGDSIATVVFPYRDVAIAAGRHFMQRFGH